MDSARQTQGMIVVSGPSASGKSTTLYSLLSERLSGKANVVTLGDPIEYRPEGLNHIRMNAKSGPAFAGCLRSILEQDPDVILVGELQDLETSDVAFQAASGHLVLTTLDADNSVSTLKNLIDLGVDPFAITASVTLVIAQRLARCTCSQCREPYSPSETALSQIKWDEPGFRFTRGGGCEACHGTGFQGRTGIFEVLRLNHAVRKILTQGAEEMDIRRAAMRSSFVPLLTDARDKIRRGILTPEEVVRVVQPADEWGVPCPQWVQVELPCPASN